MRKLLTIFTSLLVLSIIIGMIGCDGGTESTPTPTPTTMPIPTSTLTHTPTRTPTPTPTPTTTPAPSFSLSLLTISPAEALSGQQVQVSATISNSGGSGTYRAELEVDGAVVDAKDVWVPRGEARTVTFIASKDAPGVYSVLLGDRRGSFTVSNPPLHLTLDYIGVKNDHNSGGPGQIFLILLVDDGIQQVKTTIPLEEATPMEISDYRTVPIGETYKNAFDSGSVGSYFNIAILAYHKIQQGPSYWSMIGQLADYFFGLGGLGQLTGSMIDQVNSQAPQYDYVGSYQGRWNNSNSWGIGQYNDVGDDDLRLWFRIWSDSPQPIIPQPTPPLPIITSVSTINPTQTQTITISGQRFGQQNPYNGDSQYLSVKDLTRNWAAGYTGCGVTLNVTSWSDTQIVISGFAGQYGAGSYTLHSGDSIQIQVWNVPYLTGPATYTTTIH
jgi:hypothetical protein